MANRDLKSVVYTGDRNGVQFATKIDAAVFAQETTPGTPDVGGADYDGSPLLYPLPSNIVPRHVVVVSAANNVRKVICLTSTAPLYTGAVTTINLQVLGAGAVAYTVVGPVPERAIKHNPAE